MMMMRHQFPGYSSHSDSSLFDSGLNQRMKDYKSVSNVDSNRTSTGKQWNKAVYNEQVGSIQSIQYFDFVYFEFVYLLQSILFQTS